MRMHGGARPRRGARIAAADGLVGCGEMGCLPADRWFRVPGPGRPARLSGRADGPGLRLGTLLGPVLALAVVTPQGLGTRKLHLADVHVAAHLTALAGERTYATRPNLELAP